MASALPLPVLREFRPPSPLTGLLEAIWTFALPPQAAGNESLFADHVLPDGCVEIICRLPDRQGPDQSPTGRVFLRGPRARFEFVPIAWGARYVGARIKPGMALSALHIKPLELGNARIGPSEILSNAARFDGAGRAQTLHEACRALAADVARASARHGAHADDATAALAIALIQRHHGRVALADLARQLGCSERTLHRRVTAAVGLSPKVFSRIARLQHATVLIRRDRQRPLSTIALHAGYADQAHMTREFTRLAGLSPARVRQQRWP